MTPEQRKAWRTRLEGAHPNCRYRPKRQSVHSAIQWVGLAEGAIDDGRVRRVSG